MKRREMKKEFTKAQLKAQKTISEFNAANRPDDRAAAEARRLAEYLIADKPKAEAQSKARMAAVRNLAKKHK